MLHLIIDRVGNVNVFNILEDNIPSDESHLQSVVDEDLIFEYIEEVENLVKVSSALNLNKNTISSDILQELKVLGETFFEQFFPPKVSEKLRLTTSKHLFLYIDPFLGLIPWDILHDGTCFLSDRFFVGRSIRGGVSANPVQTNDKTKMLIISDPSEELFWAQKEAEYLYEYLTNEISPSTLEIEFIGGKQVTKLKLLSLIKGKNIIHYCGHLHFSKEPLENGWLLSDDKILKAREIKNSGFDTDLVFSNSCSSNKGVKTSINTDLMNQFAGSFLQSGIRNFLGTNWEIPDSKFTIDFTAKFYKHIFENRSVGEALYLAKEYARRNYGELDLTWANYSLHGNPAHILINKQKKESDNFKVISASKIQELFPTPIAKTYQAFYDSNAKSEDLKKQFLLLVTSFEEFTKFMGVLLMSEYRHRSLGKLVPNNPDDQASLSKWWEQLFTILWEFRKLKIIPLLDKVTDVLNHNREIIQKINGWIEEIAIRFPEKEVLESYLITFQFYYENILSELSELENLNVIILSESSNYHYQFKGVNPRNSLMTAPKVKNDYIGEQIEKYRGQLVVLHEMKKIMMPFLANITENDVEELEINILGFKKTEFSNSLS